jgi:hypothetical protein
VICIDPKLHHVILTFVTTAFDVVEDVAEGIGEYEWNGQWWLKVVGPEEFWVVVVVALQKVITLCVKSILQSVRSH